MADTPWTGWRDDWRRMEAVAHRRGWDLTPLAIGPPAKESDLARIEAAYGMAFPPQLRLVLTRFSAHVAFGWHIPTLLRPPDRLELPNMSANRGAVWDLAQIEHDAIPNFLNWKKHLAERDDAEAVNTPEMWADQFPFYTLVNGDMLTIDMAAAGAQPVRYFSHELEALHGLALAPDFFTFMTEMARLGCAGTEWASWLRFGSFVEDERSFYITADSPGGRAWRGWLDQDPGEIQPDEPPPPVVAASAADRALLTAARANSTLRACTALAEGAAPDAVWGQDWLDDHGEADDEFATATIYAVRHDNIPLLECLARHGARFDTRRLPVAEAVETGGLATLRWLVDHGARVDGWPNERGWPLKRLVSHRSQSVAESREDYEKRLRAENWFEIDGLDAETSRMLRQSQEDIVQRSLRAYLDPASYLAMLEALLAAGAAPDACDDDGITALMWGDQASARLLLKYGADIHARDAGGWGVMHRARTPEKLRLLAEYGAEIDALVQPARPSPEDLLHTPLQGALLGSSDRSLAMARTLLELGADPLRRGADGRSTLCYCSTLEGFALIRAYGVDPLEPLPDGGTLLHNLLRVKGVVRRSFPDEVALLDHLIGLGLDINATDDAGRTMLHVAAQRYDAADDVAVLLERGADKSIKDKAGKRPVDLVRKSLKEIRGLLK